MSSLLRSTKFFRYFTGATRTLIINSAKTAESNSFSNLKTCAVNNVVLRDYSTTKKSESIEPMLQKLDLEVRKYGRITKKDIDEVFDELKAKNEITSSQSLLVIRCCGDLVPEELPEQRTLLVQKIWNVLIERGIHMDISHYNALLRVYLENEHPFSPAKFLEELDVKGLQPNRVTYQRLMWRYCQEGDVDGATKVLEKMRELGFPVSEPVLNALVMGHAFHGDTDGAKAVLETMAGAGLQPTNHTYTLLACGYAKQGDIDEIENVIKSANNKDVLMTDKDILEIIEHLAYGGHADKVEQLFPYLQKSHGYNQDVCNVILRLLNKGHDNVAKKIMTTMPKVSISDDTPFKGAFYVKQLLRLDRPPEKIIEACRELKDEGLVPNSIFIATEFALQNGHTELALKLFEDLKKEGLEIRQHFYWPLLAQKVKENDEEGLIQIIRTMSQNNLVPTGEALRDYVLPYLVKRDSPQNVLLKLQIANVPIIHAARNLMIELLDSGNIKDAANIAIQYRPRGQYNLVSRPLVNALTKTKDIQLFVNILHVISSKPQFNQVDEDNANDDVHIDDNSEIKEFGRIVKAAIKSLSNPEENTILLEKVHAKGLRIDVKTAEEIEQYLGKHMTTHLSELLTLLTSPDLEITPLQNPKRGVRETPRNSIQLENLLAQLKSKDGVSLNKIQKQLLEAYINENKVEKLNVFVEELKASEFELTVPVMLQLYELYCNNDDIERALQYKAQILERNPNFVFSRFKLIVTAYALIRGNRYEDAVQFLKDYRPGETEKTGFMLNSKSWQMLNYLAEQKDVAKVKEVAQILLENNYIDPSNVVLGPLIKVHLLKNDIDGALAEFERCCNQYRCTPWKGELMKALIMKEDASKLQWLADLSTQIHGEVNILHDLVIAFVECGRLRQARRILETPGLNARHRRFYEACQRYVEEGKSIYLEGLLEATKELSHIDRSNIFYQLLITYCNNNETDKALGLWTLLQEEGEIPSEKFLLHLGNHLKANNREIPFVIPENTLQSEDTNKTVSEPKQKKSVKIEKLTANTIPRPSKQQITTELESQIKEGQLLIAAENTLKSIEMGTIPKPNVVKYLLRSLAEAGNVDIIKKIGEYLSDNTKRRVTYDDKLTLAIFNQGAGSSHVEHMLESIQNAKSEEDFTEALKMFPRSNALASIINNDDLVDKCEKVAELAASKGSTLPANLLWLEYILAGKDQKADAIWSKHLQNSDSIVFRRLLQESHIKKQPELIEKLLKYINTNKAMSPASIGNAYSRLINYYVLENKINDAETAFETAIKSGVPLEKLNKSTLQRLKNALENVGKQFDYIY